jgi:dsRNA-specific ribonuclease
VVMRSSDELLSTKYLEWVKLEAAMKAQYMEEERQVEARLKIEREDDEAGQVYTVSSTGANLTFGNARALLERFCQLLKKVPLEPNPRPTFVCRGTHGINMSAKVILPSSLPSGLREVHGSRVWRTEKSAKVDASFNAYKQIHEAGLVDDHLVPPCIPKKDAPFETRAAFANIQCQFNPWRSIPSDTTGDKLLHVYRLDLEDAPSACSSVLLLLPDKLQSSFSIPLQYTKLRSIQARVVYSGSRITSAAFRTLAEEISMYLLRTTLSSQSKTPESWSNGRPFYLLPDIPEEDLRGWYSLSRNTMPLIHALKSIPALHGTSVLVRDTNNRGFLLDLPRNNPKQSTSLFVVHESIPGPAVLAKKLPRRIDYLTVSNAPVSMDGRKTATAVDGCSLEQLSSPVVEAMQFIPSVIHMMGIVLLSKACCDQILGSFHISDTTLVAEALTSPLANGRANYERLEFFGDTLLKFYACLQVFADPNNGHLPEGYLTIEAMNIENNARLQRAAIEIGLDKFMIHEPFIPKKWKPETCQSLEEQQASSRQASTKTVADHVEAVIAIAYLDGTGNYSGDHKAVTLLHGLFPEVKWNLPGINARSLSTKTPADTPSFEALPIVESMLGYNFKRRHLLAEALNHSSVSASVPTYGRLEFLGDAVLQRIVNEAVYKAAPRYSQNAMHLRQIACVSHSYLAFLCFEVRNEVERNTVSTDPTQKDVTVEKITETKHLYQFMSHSSMEVGPAQQRSLHRYLELREQIREGLEQSKTYPWALLASIAAPKFFSDIMESVLGAIFIDCGPDLEICSNVLEKLGLMKLLRRLIKEPDIVLEQPKTLLWQERAKAGLPALKAVSRNQKEEGGQRFCCQLLLDGEVYAEVDDAWCDEEAVLRVCEVGLAKFRKEMDESKMPEVEVEASQLSVDDGGGKRKREDSSQEALSVMVDDD